MAEFTANVRLLVEGEVTVEAPDEEAAYTLIEEMDYVQVLNGMAVEVEEFEVLGEIEEIVEEDGVEDDEDAK